MICRHLQSRYKTCTKTRTRNPVQSQNKIKDAFRGLVQIVQFLKT